MKNKSQKFLKEIIYDKNQRLFKKMRAIDHLTNESDIMEIAEWINHPTLICKALLNENLKNKAFIEKYKKHKNSKVREVAGFKINKLKNK